MTTSGGHVPRSALRLLMGLVGGVLLIGGAVLAATELRIAYIARPYGPAAWAALACALLSLAGGMLLRRALRAHARTRAQAATSRGVS